MNSPIYFEAETFVENPMSDQTAIARLMEEFSIESDPSKGVSFTSTPLLFTPAFINAYQYILAARMIFIVLNFTTPFFLIAGISNTFESALPINIIISVFVFVISLITTDALTSGKESEKKIPEEVREVPDSKRTAVMVEDPITGERRWMLKLEQEKKETGLLGQSAIAKLDSVCGVLLFISIVLSASIPPKHSKTILALMLTDRILSLILLTATGVTTYLLMREKETINQDSGKCEYD